MFNSFYVGGCVPYLLQGHFIRNSSFLGQDGVYLDGYMILLSGAERLY